MFTSVNHRAAAAYKRIAADTGVQTASPHQLVTMLFDALIQSLNQARGAMASGHIETKGVAIGKSVRILEEGLKAGLNMAQGGELASNLRANYDYCIVRLTQANLHNDGTALTEVIGLIEPVADAWKGIQAPGTAAMPTALAAGA